MRAVILVLSHLSQISFKGFRFSLPLIEKTCTQGGSGCSTMGVGL